MGFVEALEEVLRAGRCSAPSCNVVTMDKSGWIREEPRYGQGLFPLYCEKVAPTPGFLGLNWGFENLCFCSRECQRSWWVWHGRVCGCSRREMQTMIMLPPDARLAREDPGRRRVVLSCGEYSDRFGRYGWLPGSEFVCGRCRGSVRSSCGDNFCEDPVCGAEDCVRMPY